MERVGDVPDDHAEQRAPAAAQRAGQQVRPVAELVGGGEDALARVSPDRDAGLAAVEDARDGRDRDAGPLGHVAQGDGTRRTDADLVRRTILRRWLAPGLTPGLSFRTGQTSRLIVDPQRQHTPAEHRRWRNAVALSRQAHPSSRSASDGTASRQPRRPGRLHDGLRSRARRRAAELRPPALPRRDHGRPVAGLRAPASTRHLAGGPRVTTLDLDAARRPTPRRCRRIGASSGSAAARPSTSPSSSPGAVARPLFQVPTAMTTNAPFSHRAAAARRGPGRRRSARPSRRRSTSTST